MNLQLRPWQKDFLDEYHSSNAKKSLLVACVGSGKTITTMLAAKRQIENKQVSKVVIITDRLMLKDQWRHVGDSVGLSLSDNLSNYENGASLTIQSLINKDHFNALKNYTSEKNCLFIFDGIHRSSNRINELSEELSKSNYDNKFLFLSSLPIDTDKFDWTHTFNFGREFLYQPELLKLPESKIEIAKFSPSINLWSQFQSKMTAIDEMSWRQFEILISKLLEADGYEIELMQGTKDGGVDIVAEKDMGETGLFKAVWQAKKYKTSRKIGISTIRELADVRNEHSASKGILVTSSFLTKGALDRIYRDRYILGKVARNDLTAWIDKTSKKWLTN